MQLLYVANRLEWLPQLAGWLAAGDVVICDRYRASSVAYGEAQGLDAAWLLDIQRGLPAPDLTLVPGHCAGHGRGPQGEGPRPLTNGIWSCCRASEPATVARRPATGGCSSTAKPPSRTWLGRWMRRFHHGSRHRQRPHVPDAVLQERSRARIQRGARRHHVVNQDHGLACEGTAHRCRAARTESSTRRRASGSRGGAAPAGSPAAARAVVVSSRRHTGSPTSRARSSA